VIQELHRPTCARPGAWHPLGLAGGCGLGLVFLVTFIKKGGQATLAAGLFMVAIGTLTALQLLGVFQRANTRPHLAAEGWIVGRNETAVPLGA